MNFIHVDKFTFFIDLNLSWRVPYCCIKSEKYTIRNLMNTSEDRHSIEAGKNEVISSHEETKMYPRYKR